MSFLDQPEKPPVVIDPTKLKGVITPNPVDPDAYVDLLCKGEVDISDFGDSEPMMVPCMGNVFHIQASESGGLKVICAKCGQEVEIN